MTVAQWKSILECACLCQDSRIFHTALCAVPCIARGVFTVKTSALQCEFVYWLKLLDRIEYDAAVKTTQWYRGAVLHRDHGPALIDTSLGCSDFITPTQVMWGRLSLQQEFSIDILCFASPIVKKWIRYGKVQKVYILNSYFWYQNGMLHRDDGPAVECFGGGRHWYRDGKKHRIGGPAVELSDGTKEWWLDGKHHRADGPAVEWASGTKTWCVDGKLHRTDGPAIETADGGKQWWVDGKQHRTDGPAVERADGEKQWWVDGRLHRTDGAAIERANGVKEVWIHGFYMGASDACAVL